MDVKDLARIAGKRAIERYPWGDVVLSVIEESLEEKDRATISSKSTGTDIEYLINKLPERKRLRVLQRRFNIRQAVDQQLEEETKEEIEIEDGVEDVLSSHHKSVVFIMFMGGGIAIIVLILLAYVIIGYRTGQLPDLALLRGVYDIVRDLSSS